MRKSGYALLILVLLFTVVTACSKQTDSSTEEARYVVQQMPDFKELIQYFSVRSGRCIGVPLAPPWIEYSDPKMEKNWFVHAVIYKTKNNTFKLILLDDSRPPKIVTMKEFS